MAKLTLVLAIAFICGGMNEASPQVKRSTLCPTQLDIIFVLDESGSIYYLDFEKQLDFVSSYIDRFDTSPNVTHVGVMTFSTDPKTHIPLSSHADKAALQARVKGIDQRRGQTMTDDALTHMTRMMNANRRSWVPHIAVVITDGEPDDKAATARAAAAAHAAGITIIAIGVGRRNVGRDVLLSIASSPNLVHRIDNYASLDKILISLTDTTCEITTVPPPTTRPPPTTTLPLLISGCRSQARLDIAFALPDFIGARETGLALNFVNELAGEFQLGSTSVQTAITPRYCYADEPIFLNQYDSVVRFRTTLIERRAIPGAATAYHLNHMATRTFTQMNGARRGAIKIGIVVVDESSNGDDLMYAVEAAKKKGIHLIAIGVGDQVDSSELHTIASTGADVFGFPTYDALTRFQTSILTRLCEIATT